MGILKQTSSIRFQLNSDSLHTTRPSPWIHPQALRHLPEYTSDPTKPHPVSGSKIHPGTARPAGNCRDGRAVVSLERVLSRPEPRLSWYGMGRISLAAVPADQLRLAGRAAVLRAFGLSAGWEAVAAVAGLTNAFALLEPEISSNLSGRLAPVAGIAFDRLVAAGTDPVARLGRAAAQCDALDSPATVDDQAAQWGLVDPAGGADVLHRAAWHRVAEPAVRHAVDACNGFRNHDGLAGRSHRILRRCRLRRARIHHQRPARFPCVVRPRTGAQRAADTSEPAPDRTSDDLHCTNLAAVDRMAGRQSGDLLERELDLRRLGSDHVHGDCGFGIRRAAW